MSAARPSPKRPAPVTATEDAYGAILDLILNQELRSGERTSVNLLARRLTAGKTPIKEAIIRLRTEGVLTVSGRSGTTVNEVSGNQAIEMFGARRLLEDFVSDAVVANITPHQLDNLHSLCRVMSKLSTGRALNLSADFVRANKAFHSEIVASSGNATIARLYDQLQIHSQIMSYLLSYQADPVRAAKKRQKEHESIVQAIETRNAPLLRTLLRAHAAASEKIILEQLSRREAHRGSRPSSGNGEGTAALARGCSAE